MRKIYEEEILKKIYEIMRENLYLGKDIKIDMLSKFSDLDMDELDIVEIAMDLEDEFDILIPDRKTDKMKSVMDLYVYLCKVLGVKKVLNVKKVLDAEIGSGEINSRFEILDL